MKDRDLGIIGVIGFSFLMYTLRGKSLQTVAFPMALLIILIVLCLVFVFRGGEKGSKKYAFKSLGQILLYGGLFAAYLVVLPYAGFMISTTVFLSAFLLLQRYPMKWYKIILLSAAISVVLWLLFAKGFSVRLPEILL